MMLQSDLVQRRRPLGGATILPPPALRNLTLSTACREEVCLWMLLRWDLERVNPTDDLADIFHRAHLRFLHPYIKYPPTDHHHPPVAISVKCSQKVNQTDRGHKLKCRTLSTVSLCIEALTLD